MVDPSPPNDRASSRAALRDRRARHVAALGPDGRDRAERAIADHLAPLIAATATLGAYCAVGDEVRLDPALALARGFIAFPAFGDGDPCFTFRLGPAIRRGRYGIPEPAAEAPALHPALVLVPLLGIDGEGNRLGQGGGHYDRVLPALAEGGSRLLGVGWDCQRLDRLLDVEPWDVPLDGFVSESGLTWF